VGVLDQRIADLREDVEMAVREALETASSWDPPDVADRLTSVLA
jgi:hypothetical protein